MSEYVADVVALLRYEPSSPDAVRNVVKPTAGVVVVTIGVVVDVELVGAATGAMIAFPAATIPTADAAVNAPAVIHDLIALCPRYIQSSSLRLLRTPFYRPRIRGR